MKNKIAYLLIMALVVFGFAGTASASHKLRGVVTAPVKVVKFIRTNKPVRKFLANKPVRKAVVGTARFVVGR